MENFIARNWNTRIRFSEQIKRETLVAYKTVLIWNITLLNPLNQVFNNVI